MVLVYIIEWHTAEIWKNLYGGAKDQDRTGDPSLFRGMLYQLSYLGVGVFTIF
jgi:hypothetical protein